MAVVWKFPSSRASTHPSIHSFPHQPTKHPHAPTSTGGYTLYITGHGDKNYTNELRALPEGVESGHFDVFFRIYVEVSEFCFIQSFTRGSGLVGRWPPVRFDTGEGVRVRRTCQGTTSSSSAPPTNTPTNNTTTGVATRPAASALGPHARVRAGARVRVGLGAAAQGVREAGVPERQGVGGDPHLPAPPADGVQGAWRGVAGRAGPGASSHVVSGRDVRPPKHLHPNTQQPPQKRKQTV